MIGGQAVGTMERLPMRLKMTLALLALTTATTVSLPAQAQFQELGSIARMLLLLPEEEKPPIDYRERPPLVVPPNKNLRPPATTSSPEQRRANWPVDPEVEGRRRAAEEARRPRNFDSVLGREDQMGGVRRMTPNEIAAGRIRGAGVPQRGEVGPPVADPLRPTADNALAGIVALPQIRNPEAEGGDVLQPGVEPRRRFLTEPPVGTRMPAGNAPVRASRDQDFRPVQQPSPFDIFREAPRTR
jgi:hypothetical protein